MRKILILSTLLLFIGNILNAQTTTELQKMLDDKSAMLAAKVAEVAALEGEIAGIKGQMVVYPEWTLGALGTIGGNFSKFNKWLGTANPNTQSSNFGFTGSAFANLQEEKYFWRNGLNLNIAKTKVVQDHTLDGSEDIDFETTADAINISSLFGWKLTDKWAISALGEYRSTILSNFNNPGYLDIGAGATWTPIKNFVAVFHPLNYNIVMADSDVTYESSLGCKIVADYTQSLPMGVAWRSNLSAFVSYSDPSNFSNWTWVNGLNFTAWKGIGVGFEFGLRGNRQESYNSFLKGNVDNPAITAETVAIDDFDGGSFDGDHPLQTYWLLGLTYNISR